MEKITFWQCVGDLNSFGNQTQIENDMAWGAKKQCKNLEDMEKHLENILEEYKQKTGKVDAKMNKFPNWGVKNSRWHWWVSPGCLSGEVYQRTITIE